MSDGRKITADLVLYLIKDELEKLRSEVGTEKYDAGHYDLASEIFIGMTTQNNFEEFLTTGAYERLLSLEQGGKLKVAED